MMKNFIWTLMVGSILILSACNGNNTTTTAVGTGSLEGFNLTSTPNSAIQHATKTNTNGDVIEEGEVVNGKREGAWMTYHEGNRAGVLKSVASYINNQIQGAYMEFDNIGRVELKSFYSNGQLHGPYVKYKYGKPVEEAIYVNGKLDGLYKTYYQNGKKQQETQYKNGVKEGRSIFYNEQEQIIMDYQYKNDKQVSGGPVTPPSE